MQVDVSWLSHYRTKKKYNFVYTPNDPIDKDIV